MLVSGITFKKKNAGVFWLVIDFVTLLLCTGTHKTCEQILESLDIFNQISNMLVRGLNDTLG